MLAHDLKNGKEFVFPTHLVREPGPEGSQVKNLKIPPVEFPQLCAHCGASRTDLKYVLQDVTSQFTVNSRVNVKDAVIFEQQFLVPFCPDCHRSYRRVQIMRPVVILLSILLALAIFFIIVPVDLRNPQLPGLTGLALLGGCILAGYLFGLIVLRVLASSLLKGLRDWPWFRVVVDPYNHFLRFFFKNSEFARAFEAQNEELFRKWESQMTHKLL